MGAPTNAALLTSAQKAIDVSVLDFFNQVEGGYLGGTDYAGILANDGVLLSPYHDYEDDISADYKNGVLEVHVKKPEQPQPKRIQIGSNGKGRGNRRGGEWRRDNGSSCRDG